MYLFGVVLATIGFISLVLPTKFGVEFFVVGAIADSLGISSAMLSTLMIALGFAFILVRAVLGLFRVIKSRIAGKGQNEEQL